MLVISLILLSLYLFSKLRSLNKEVNLLAENIAEINSEMPEFRNLGVKRIFSTYLVNSSRLKDASTIADSDIVSMGASIASKVAEPNAVAEELANLINSKIGSELVGVSILVLDSGKLTLTQSVGLPIKRIGEAIEVCCYEVMSSDSWGYQQNSNWSDFSIFGIKRSLVLPLRSENQIQGVLWLGLSSTLLSVDKSELIKKIAEYAAASFQVAKDFSKEKEFQQKEKDFLLGLSHDLRSPGNRALFCVRDLLYDTKLSLSQINREQLEIVEQSIEEQMSMINDVLDIAKHQGGLLKSSPIRVNLAKELLDLKSRYKVDLERKRLLLEFKCAHEIELYVDPTHFRRILNNLVSNAIKFTNVGGIFIDIEDLDSNVEIVFRDTGSGISKQIQTKIFEKFSPSKAGYGLGLYLVKALAEINNGEVITYPSHFSGANLGVRMPKRVVND